MRQQLLLKYRKILFACFILLSIAGMTHAQNKKARVLFIGNSYTQVNDLPKLVADMAASTGDTLEYDISAPGGASFNHHYVTNTVTKAKIQAGGWDYVVLQEQSLEPARAPAYFDFWVYNFAKYLVDDVRLYNPCAQVIFYMTWGRKNGFPPFCPQPFTWRHYCTYHTMDSVIRARYMLMADSNQATVSPVGAVWRYIRANHPGIELYDADESHPSSAGSYAGACSFYTAIFKKPADSINYNFSLPTAEAATIRMVASKVVYDSLAFWHIGKYETIAGFSHHANGMQTVSFSNKSANATQYEWNFGDGQTSTQTNPTHIYTSPGIYNVRLVATGRLQCKDTTYGKIDKSLPAATFTIAPNPATDWLYIKSRLFPAGNYRIQIQNIMGQIVYERQSTGAETQSIYVAGIAGGVYTLKIFNPARSMYRKKIVILH
jgi:hypothetical protein